MLHRNTIVDAELTHRISLRRPPHNGFDDSAGQTPLLVEFKMIALHVGNTKKAGDG
jgi:hypothetical protein